MPGRDFVVDFWQAVDTHDWELLASTITDDFVRVGMDPDDVCSGKEPYLAFVSKVTGRMDRHALETRAIFYSEDRRRAVAECRETIVPPGEDPLVMDFVNLHELSEDGRIARLDIYWKTQRRMPPDWIAVQTVLAGGGSP